MARIMKRVIMTMLIVCMIITVNTAGVFAGKVDSLTETEKKSSLGFFTWLSENADTASEREDAAIAAELLTNTLTSAHETKVFNNGQTIATNKLNVTYEELVANLKIGQENDATSLDCLEDAVNFIISGNTYRAKENLAPLKVSSALMAMGELNIDIQDWQSGRESSLNTFGHTTVFRPLENLAVRMIGRTWAYGSAPNASSDDPYEGWYTEEKKNYDNNNGGQTGHYKTLTDRQGTMLITGFGVRHRFVDTTTTAYWGDGHTTTEPCTDHYKYYSQIFSTMSGGMYDVTAGVTPAKYLEYLDRYSCIAGAHDLTKTAAKQPTCVQAGNSEYYTCSKCGKYFSDSEGKNEIAKNSWVLPATGNHTYDQGTVTKAATCEENGIRTYTCKTCGNKKTEVIQMIGHTWDISYKWSSDNLSVTASAVCRNDSSHKVSETVDTKVVTKEATEEAEGQITYTATFTNNLFSSRSKTVTLPKLGHDLKEIAEVPAKCIETGTKLHYICNNCGKIFLDKDATKEVTSEELVIPMTGHDYGPWENISTTHHRRVCKNDSGHAEYGAHRWDDGTVTKKADCSTEGTKTYKCTVCDAEKTETIPALGHDIKLVAGTEATCEAAGNTEHYKCDRCGELFEDKEGTTKLEESDVVIPATGHSYGAWESISDEQHQRVCEHDASHVEKAAHTWDAGTVISEATETETGLKKYTCTVCGAAKEEVIPVIKPEPVDPEPDEEEEKPENQMGIDGTPTGKGASAEAAEAAITGLKKDADPAGSKVAPLFVRSTKQTKKSLVLTWKRPAGAKTFVIYGNQCGKTKKIKKIMTTSKTKVTVKKAVKKITKGKYYKFIVVSLDKNRKVVSTSKMIHVATKGGKVGNFKKVTTKAKKNKVTLAKGKTFKLAGKGIPQSKKLKVKAHVGIRYESANTAVATVSKKGIIKAIKKGTTYIYAYSQNGTYAKIKVTVK